MEAKITEILAKNITWVILNNSQSKVASGSFPAWVAHRESTCHFIRVIQIYPKRKRVWAKHFITKRGPVTPLFISLIFYHG